MAVAGLVGIASGSHCFFFAGRWAHVEATGEPKFEVPFSWLLGEGVIVGLACAVLACGIGTGLRWFRSQ